MTLLTVHASCSVLVLLSTGRAPAASAGVDSIGSARPCLLSSSVTASPGRVVSAPTPPTLPSWSTSGCQSRRSSSASLRIWRACPACSYAARVSPGTTGESSSSSSRRRPCLARMICFSARSMVAVNSDWYASLSFWRVYAKCQRNHFITKAGRSLQYSSTVPPQPDSLPRP